MAESPKENPLFEKKSLISFAFSRSPTVRNNVKRVLLVMQYHVNMVSRVTLIFVFIVIQYISASNTLYHPLCLMSPSDLHSVTSRVFGSTCFVHNLFPGLDKLFSLGF